MGGGPVGPGFGPFTPPPSSSSPSVKPKESPKLSPSPQSFNQPIVNRCVLDAMPALLPSAEPEGEPMPIYELSLNNQPIELPAYIAQDVANAVAQLRLDPEKAKILSKELLLNADILIGLLNETKFGLQQRSPIFFTDTCRGNDRIEQAFIENKFLSLEEKEWVKETIADYKRLVKSTVSQNTPRPITPPPSIISLPPAGKCSCNIL